MFRKLKEMDITEDQFQTVNRVIFQNTLVKKLESVLLDQIKVVRLDSTEVIKGNVICMIDITVLEDGPDSVGEAVFVGPADSGGKIILPSE